MAAEWLGFMSFRKSVAPHSTSDGSDNSCTARHLGSRDYPISPELSRVSGSSCDWLALDAGRRPSNGKDDIPLTCVSGIFGCIPGRSGLFASMWAGSRRPRDFHRVSLRVLDPGTRGLGGLTGRGDASKC
ncbi:hypothetical protein RRG08_059354 [Elysia crispata]|uniref:Uncharacterized protein n=1 Tax=Elysia crispata TaxID=231223 RepID=A0AAE1BDP1_9GAST|nr:hypothetical protein RRG08_059354 [Elysia crispata]